ncbi:transposase [Microcoleus sp. CAWBG58]|uniref:RNA-guided endonuclease InsQ/TnpB family protein n=1 Tax=Microcoleus sp. CAWBG58 TaxID=2841651 RepID=UPI0025E7A4AF|nr:transposase [Microcoleus sp. CAWBG58]
MNGRSSQSKMEQDNAFRTLSPAEQMERSAQSPAIAELAAPSKKTTSEDKSNLCGSDTPTQKSSKILAWDSTSKEKDCKPYWSDLCAQISSRLLLPLDTSKADSDLNFSSSWQNKTVDRSWFSQILFTVQDPNSQRIFLPSFTTTVAECTPGEVLLRKSKKIRLFLSPEQKALLKQWFGVSRYVYNVTIKYLQQSGTKTNWMSIKTDILNGLPDWAKPVPFQIKSIAIKDACAAVKKAKADFKKTGKICSCKFRSQKDTKQSLYIPKSAIGIKGIYHTKLGWSKLKEALPIDFSDGRLTLAYGEYYIVVSEEVQPRQTDNQGRVVALDPGVRTFMTFFSESSYGWLGNDSNLLIQKLCFRLDKLSSRMSKTSSPQRKRLRKAADRLKSKIQHLVKELHHKTAKFLVDRFDAILLPSFESSQMVSKSRRKIRSKTVRQMLTLSHYQFKKHLEWKAWEQGKVALSSINEAYTSKTVSWTGEVKKIGGSRTIKDSDGNQMNRDLNGARGIFLRALVDTPWLKSFLAI